MVQDPQAWPPGHLPPHVHNEASAKPLDAGPEQPSAPGDSPGDRETGLSRCSCDPQARRSVIKAQPHQDRTRGSSISGAGLAQTGKRPLLTALLGTLLGDSVAYMMLKAIIYSFLFQTPGRASERALSRMASVS